MVIAFYCIVLYCIVLYCIVLYCIVLYCIVLYCIVLYCTALHCTALHCIALHFIEFCYIDTSVLLENIPLVKFIKTTSGTRVVYFPKSHTWVYRWRNVGNFPLLFYRRLFVYIIKRTFTRRLEDMNFISSWQK